MSLLLLSWLLVVVANEFGLVEDTLVATSDFGQGVELGMSVATPDSEMGLLDIGAGGGLALRSLLLVVCLMVASSFVVYNKGVTCHSDELNSVVLHVRFSVANLSSLLCLFLLLIVLFPV